MKGKRLLALTLSAAMMTGSSAMVFAADMEGGEQGKGEVQYVAESDVFTVVLPTAKAEGAASTFDYILDPDSLITATKDQADKRYTGTFETGKTVYFKHSTAVNGNDYTDTSDELVITNKSTQDVVLTVTAKVAEADGVTMDADGTFSAATGSGNLYMALKGKVSGETADTVKVITADGVSFNVTIPKDPAAYEVKWNADKKQYEKALTSAAQDSAYTDFKTYTFSLTGSCKPNDAALLALKENPPKVDLTWSVKDFTITGPQVTLSSSGLITITGLTEDANVGNGATDILVGFASENDGDTTLYPVVANGVTWITDSWDTTTGGTLKIQLKAGTYNPYDGKSINVAVKLTDGTTINGNTTITNVAE